MSRKQIVIGRVAVILSVAFLLIWCGSDARAVRGIEPASAMTDLNNLGQLKDVFVRDRGKVRLVALLSPV